MSFNVDSIRFYLSGGAGNTNPQASLGGIISSQRVLSQTTSALVNVTGVTISSATNNAQGVGILSWTPATNTLAWQPPGSATIYQTSGVTVNGTYTVGGGDGLLVLDVVYASLAAVYKQDSVTIANASQNVFDSVSAADSLVGSINYRCIYIKNVHGSIAATGTKVWIKQLTTGPDEIDIGLDPAGIGNGSTTGVATTVGNENSAPAGVTFSRPLTYGTGLTIGTLAAGESIALWQRRTVDAETVGNITANRCIIGVAVTV
jgi:hypothetical protein